MSLQKDFVRKRTSAPATAPPPFGYTTVPITRAFVGLPISEPPTVRSGEQENAAKPKQRNEKRFLRFEGFFMIVSPACADPDGLWERIALHNGKHSPDFYLPARSIVFFS